MLDEVRGERKREKEGERGRKGNSLELVPPLDKSTWPDLGFASASAFRHAFICRAMLIYFVRHGQTDE
jgi:hypothetical protein